MSLRSTQTIFGAKPSPSSTRFGSTPPSFRTRWTSPAQSSSTCHFAATSCSLGRSSLMSSSTGSLSISSIFLYACTTCSPGGTVRFQFKRRGRQTGHSYHAQRFLFNSSFFILFYFYYYFFVGVVLILVQFQ